MRIACLADTHISYWLPYANIGDGGIPDRLSLYPILADDLVKTFKKEKVEIAVIAGDLFESSFQRPQTLNAGADFLRILSSNIPVYLIHGNHDIDFRGETIDKRHSILTEVCEGLDNVVYESGESIHEVNSYKILFRSWNGNCRTPEEEADIFVGHGAVINARIGNFVFGTGFNPEELSRKYKFSIIGDIHHNDVYTNKRTGYKVIIPGCLAQNGWSDSSNNGFYIINIKNSGRFSSVPKFIQINEVYPNRYHRFLYCNSVSDKASTNLIHYRVKSVKQTNESSREISTKIKSKIDIKEVILRLVDSGDFSNLDFLRINIDELFTNCIDDASQSSSDYVIEKVKIKNFLSIRELELDLAGTPKKHLVFGSNGSGKSSIFESIFWCLTGVSARGLQVNDVRRLGSDKTEVEVYLKSASGKPDLSCCRIRTDKTEFKVSFNGKEYKASSIRDTQKDLTSIVGFGFSESEIRSMTYFTTSNPLLFGSMSNASRSSLISRVIGLDYIDKLREFSSEKSASLQGEVISLSTREDMHKSSLENTLRLIEEGKRQSGNDKVKEMEARLILLRSKDFTKENLANLRHNLSLEEKSFNDITAKRCEELARYKALHSGLKSLVVTDDICPTCNQKILNKEKILELTSRKEDSEKDISRLRRVITGLDQKLKLLKENSIVPLTKMIKTSEDTMDEIHSLESKVQQLDSSKVLEHLNSSKLSTKESLDEVKLKLEKVEVNLQSWKDLGKILRKGGEVYKELYKSISSFLQDEINHVCPEDSGLEIRVLEDLSIEAKFVDSNIFTSYAMMSSGQRRIVDICLMISLNNLFSKVLGLKDGILGILIFDETFSFLDNRYYDMAHSFLNASISRYIFVITHNESIVGGRRIKVTKAGDYSTYEFSGNGVQ